MDDNSPETVVQRRIPRPEDFPIAGPNSLAGFGQRTAGWCIDALITIVPVFLVSWTVLLAVNPDYLPNPEPGFFEAWIHPLIPLTVASVWVIYQILLTRLTGSTVGMFAMGMRVARYADGAKPDWSQATLRALLPGMFFAMPSVILNTLWFVVYAAALYNPLRRGLQDQAGGTIVVRTR